MISLKAWILDFSLVFTNTQTHALGCHLILLTHITYSTNKLFLVHMMKLIFHSAPRPKEYKRSTPEQTLKIQGLPYRQETGSQKPLLLVELFYKKVIEPLKSSGIKDSFEWGLLRETQKNWKNSSNIRTALNLPIRSATKSPHPQEAQSVGERDNFQESFPKCRGLDELHQG